MRDRSPDAHDPIFPDNESDVLDKRSVAFGGPSTRRDVVDTDRAVGLGAESSATHVLGAGDSETAPRIGSSDSSSIAAVLGISEPSGRQSESPPWE